MKKEIQKSINFLMKEIKRLKKIESIETEAYKLYRKVLAETAKQKDKIFEELDEATEETISHKNSFDDINQMIDRSMIP